jgi:hypothetical protein
MKIVFCCVAIGNLGEVGKLSLNSILSIFNSKIVVFVDTEGEKWIREAVAVSDLIIKRFDFLRISEEEARILEKLDSSVEYRSFGNPKFFRLMYFKWVVLENAIKNHRDNPWVIFTDLDVYWAMSPELSLDSFQRSNSLFAIQQDAKSKKGAAFLCPGIMVWKTSTRASEILKSVRIYHEKLLQDNPIMPDDKALNLWVSKQRNADFLTKLNRHEYVIGHRLSALLLGLQGFRIRKVIAYHANYAIGLSSKSQLLHFASTPAKNVILRLYRALYLYARKIYSRARSRVTSI